MVFTWEIETKDGKVYAEGKDKFNLDWEKKDILKRGTLIDNATNEHYEVDFVTGKILKNNKEIHAGGNNPDNLIFRKRNMVRVSGSESLPLGTSYLLGYKCKSGKNVILKVSPVYKMGNNNPDSFAYDFVENL